MSGPSQPQAAAATPARHELPRYRRILHSVLPASLTVRMALAFGAIAAAILIAVGTYLAAALAAQLQERDEAELVGEVSLVRHLLTEASSEEEVRADIPRFTNLALGHEGLILIVRNRAGEQLVTLNPRFESVPRLQIVPIDTQPDISMLQTWYPRNGVASRGIAAKGRLGDTENFVEIVVLRDAGQRARLMNDYQLHIYWATLSGALVAAGMGFLLVRRGLRPLRNMAHKASVITTSRLSTRLDAGSVPTELQEMAEAFNGMLARLQDSFSRLSTFSADLAHDFRTPISNLIGQTQVTLAHARTVDEYEALLESNIEEYDRLARMIENMLFLARADHAQVALDIRLLDARSELDKVAEYYEAVAADREVTLQLAGHALVYADQALVRRAVTNLLDNALRHAPAGSAVTIAVEQDHESTRIRVANGGAGISADALPHIFGRFYRGDPARANSAASTGLGLAIVDTIMRLHGGGASASSAGGRTVLELVFPGRQSGG